VSLALAAREAPDAAGGFALFFVNLKEGDQAVEVDEIVGGGQVFALQRMV
jgi:hypothetical protein